jgi:dTDP-glucose 4,6-dehydratase
VERSAHLACDPAVTPIAGCCTSFEFPQGTFPLTIHAATERHFPADADRPYSTFVSDTGATIRVLEFAHARGVRRMLFTSSGAVYGPQPAGITHIAEDYEGGPLPCDVHSAYAQAKRASEFLCSSAARAHGFDVSIARLFAFVGPYLPLDTNYAVGNFLRDGIAGGPIRIAGDGTPYRSYLYAADLAVWLWTMLLRAPSGVPFNVGSPYEVSIAELARRVAAVTAPGAEIRVAGKPVPGASPRRYVPDTASAELQLGLRVRIPLEDGIRRTYGWHMARRAAEAVCV